MFRIVVHLGDIIAACAVAVLLLVLGLGLWMERRERRRQRLLDELALGGRQCRRKPAPLKPWWVP